jgi:hypothetical protein
MERGASCRAMTRTTARSGSGRLGIFSSGNKSFAPRRAVLGSRLRGPRFVQIFERCSQMGESVGGSGRLPGDGTTLLGRDWCWRDGIGVGGTGLLWWDGTGVVGRDCCGRTGLLWSDGTAVVGRDWCGGMGLVRWDGTDVVGRDTFHGTGHFRRNRHPLVSSVEKCSTGLNPFRKKICDENKALEQDRAWSRVGFIDRLLSASRRV